jgi:hypothetical protein
VRQLTGKAPALSSLTAGAAAADHAFGPRPWRFPDDPSICLHNPRRNENDEFAGQIAVGAMPK